MVRLSAGTGPAAGAGAVEIHIRGTVQGVGFRPHVYRLALQFNLKGWVINTLAGVTIRLEGDADFINNFCEALKSNPPPLARIDFFEAREAVWEGFGAFSILASTGAGETEASIPPDTGTCPECSLEFRDPQNRRHRYDFINCVNCGPRFSITRRAPYDRKHTSMEAFTLCDECRREYLDPGDRRFHAEPNACPVCGPLVRLTSSTGSDLAGDPISCLKAGQIMAVKGLGGYLLACDAANGGAVAALRERKRRETKPFALMCRDLAEIRRHCRVSPAEEKLLISPARPIVLLQRRFDCSLPDSLAPGLNTLGVMLPNNPLQLSLFDEDLATLVMTSANLSGDPLILTEEEAYRELAALADVFLVHNRAIVNRVDDSVVMVHREREYLIRRARGYVPLYLSVPDLGRGTRRKPVLAAGGDLKSVFALGRPDRVMLSQHFGDLANPKNLEAYLQGIGFFQGFLQIEPQQAVVDLHPGYFSTRAAESMGLPVVRVQHHKAHMASCMADNGLNEKVLGVVWDGTGYGADGTIWGCEFFYGDYQTIKRVGSIQPFKQPLGDAAQKNPRQMAAMFLQALGRKDTDLRHLIPDVEEMFPYLEALGTSERLTVTSTSSGRLFDAAAVLCGFTDDPTFEGEPAMVLEALAHAGPAAGLDGYPFTINRPDIFRISWGFLDDLAEDKLRHTPAPLMAARFHKTLGAAVISLLKRLKKEFPADKAVFSGGIFQNRWLLDYLTERVPETGLTPVFHHRVPTNDGGLALGQMMLTEIGDEANVPGSTGEGDQH